jgi:hypothetical protein
MANPLHPDHMTTTERLAEVAEILAAGLVRLRSRQSRRQSDDYGESFVDFTADPSRHATTTEEGEA